VTITNLRDVTRPHRKTGEINTWTTGSLAWAFDRDAQEKAEHALNLAGCGNEFKVVRCRHCGALLPGVLAGNRAIATQDVTVDGNGHERGFEAIEIDVSIAPPQIHTGSVRRRCPHCKEINTVYAPEA
jgi:phage FluMu protein Com